jgi:hypothetical protein
MTGPGRRFDPRELADADGSFELDDAGLAAVARELEAVAAMDATPRPPDFEDRVMAALADEPPPRPVARGWSPAAIATTVGEAWRIATTGPRPAAIRAQALALVLLVAVAALSVGSLAVVGAARWLSSDPALPPPTVAPSPGPSLVAPSPSAAPSPTLTPAPSASPSPSPSADATAAPDATETSEPTGTDDPDDTPRPTDTPDPEGTPDPEDTPEPTETDDSSGPGSGDDDGGDSSGSGSGG